VHELQWTLHRLHVASVCCPLRLAGKANQAGVWGFPWHPLALVRWGRILVVVLLGVVDGLDVVDWLSVDGWLLVGRRLLDRRAGFVLRRFGGLVAGCRRRVSAIGSRVGR
jgi:hypothetical protein